MVALSLMTRNGAVNIGVIVPVLMPDCLMRCPLYPPKQTSRSTRGKHVELTLDTTLTERSPDPISCRMT